MSSTPTIVEPFICTVPVPFGAKVIAPSAASVIVIAPEFVPEFVFKVKSYAPSEVTSAAAPPVPTLSPVDIVSVTTTLS